MALVDDANSRDNTTVQRRFAFSDNVTLPAPAAPPGPRGLRHLLARVRAWMLVIPLDAALLVAPAVWTGRHLGASLAMAAIFLVLESSTGRYRARLHLSVLDELPTLVGKLLTAAGIVTTSTALTQPSEAVTAFFVDALVGIGLVVGARVALTQLILWSRRHRLTVHRTVLIGGGPLAAELALILERHPWYGLKVVGFVDETPAAAASSVIPWLGKPRDLDRAAWGADADVLIVADGSFSERALLDMVRTPHCLPCDLLVVPRLHHFHTQTGQADHIGSIPIMRIRTPDLTGPAWRTKRVLDVVVAGVVLLLAAPLLALCAGALRLEVGPGVIVRQPHVGRDGRIFDRLTFRTAPAPDRSPATGRSIAPDERAGPVGRSVRRMSLDALPQLWNVLRGDMAMVGPRPEPPHVVAQSSSAYDRYAHRHRVPAGLTSYARVRGVPGDSPVDDRARHDNYYIENWSLWLDLKILLHTVGRVVLFRGR